MCNYPVPVARGSGSAACPVSIMYSIVYLHFPVSWPTLFPWNEFEQLSRKLLLFYGFVFEFCFSLIMVVVLLFRHMGLIYI